MLVLLLGSSSHRPNTRTYGLEIDGSKALYLLLFCLLLASMMSWTHIASMFECIFTDNSQHVRWNHRHHCPCVFLLSSFLFSSNDWALSCRVASARKFKLRARQPAVSRNQGIFVGARVKGRVSTLYLYCLDTGVFAILIGWISLGGLRHLFYAICIFFL